MVYFLSFANTGWHSDTKPLARIGIEAKSMRIFNDVILLDEKCFESWYSEKYAYRFAERGFGYWQWKPYIIKKTFDRMQKDDILLFCDAGCHLNIRGRRRMLEYLNIVKNSESGVLLFDQCLQERVWTKGDVFKFFNINYDTYEKNQCCSGVIFLRKCPNSVSLIDAWYDICHNHHDLCTDESSDMLNFYGFRENRHDQSILSMLVHNIYPAHFVSSDETYADYDWNALWNMPICAVRDYVKEAKRNAFKNRYNPRMLLKRVYKRLIKHWLSK